MVTSQSMRPARQSSHLLPSSSTLVLSLALSAAVWSCGHESQPATSSPNATDLVIQTVAGGFDTIWDLVWAPDNTLWLTERSGAISRVDPSTGAITSLGQLPVNEIGEGGLMGMALHPDFPAQPWVFVAHTYSVGGAVRNRIVRMRLTGATLGAPETLLDNIPGSSIHNGSRLVVGPDRLLYITTGDASNGALAQNRASLAGKILRLTLDGASVPGNPFTTAVYTFGHRNPQGLVFSPSGTLYATEHGPSDNDEINRIEAGRNYGWPDVHGMCDGDVGAGEVPFCQANNVAEPLRTWTPTIAPSGLAYYAATRIPSWQGSLLFTTLKGTALHRLTLAADGRSVTAAESLFVGQFGRLRDVLVAPDGAVYIATSNRDGRGSPQATDDRIVRIIPRP